MVQSACLMLVPVFIVGLILLQAGRLRQIAAAVLGLAAPYWILLGSGLASTEQLQFAIPVNITGMSGSPQLLISLCMSAGISAFSAIMLMLYNALHTLSAGVKVRACYSFINLLGCACILLMLADAANFIAYAGVLLMSLSLVVTRTVILSRSPRSWILPACLIVISLILFFL